MLPGSSMLDSEKNQMISELNEKNKIKKLKMITVIGRKWFERINGNTYHSVEVYVDGELLERNSYEYGYGRQWESTAMDILEKHGIVKHPGLICYPDELPKDEFCVVSSVTDVKRKRDL